MRDKLDEEKLLKAVKGLTVLYLRSQGVRLLYGVTDEKPLTVSYPRGATPVPECLIPIVKSITKQEWEDK